MSADLWHWSLLAAWLFLSFFLSGMEAAIMALSRLRIRQWLREGKPQARILLRYLDQPENFLWTILVGNTLANFSVTWFIVTDLHNVFPQSPIWFWITFAVSTFIVYLTCELLPKRLFRRYPNRLALRWVRLFRVLHVALSPLVACVEWFTGRLLRWAGGQEMSSRVFGNRDELRAMMQESGASLHPTERTLINRVFDLQTRTIGQLAKSLETADTVTVSTPIEEVQRRSYEGRHTRLPVWSDRGPQRRIVGVVSIRNILYAEPEPRKKTAGDFLRPAVYLNEATRLEEALHRMQRSGEHLAIVVDAGGRERGLITLGDILGTVFGEVKE
jgi:putative hemolysin